MTLQEFKSRFDGITALCHLEGLTLKQSDTGQPYVSGHTCGGALGFVFYNIDGELSYISMMGNAEPSAILFVIAILVDILLECMPEERNHILDSMGLYDARCLLGQEFHAKGYRLKIRLNKKVGVLFSLEKEGAAVGSGRTD